MAFPWKTLITAGGKLLGGLLGSKPAVRTPEDTLEATVKKAREIGIHPLAAIGSNLQYTPIPGSNPVGDAVAKAAEAIGKGTAESLEKEAVASQIEVNRAQAELLRQQGTAIQTEVRANLRNGTTGARNLGNPTGLPGLFTQVDDGQGNRIVVADQQTAPEPEQDLYARVVKGDVVAYLEELASKNVSPESGAAQTLAFVKALKISAAFKQQLERKIKAWLKRNKRPSRPVATGFGPHP